MQALKVIILIWTNPRKGLAKKRMLQRDACEGETFYEAIPTSAIFSFLLLAALYQRDHISEEPQIHSLIGSNFTLFLATYMTSLLAASFGLAKALKTGPCEILPYGGLLSCRFLLLIFASL